MKIKKIILVILLCLMALPGLCSTLDVTARVDKYKISQEDSIFLTIEVNGGKADLDLSGIKDFKVLSRGTSTSFNYINGKSQRKASYQYVLMPLSRGTLKIPALKATRKDQTAFTKQIIIHVADQIVDPHEIKALFLKAFMAKNQVFVGEQTIFTLQFFTSKRLSGLGFEKPPG
ncbi:MAG: protein BatD, partial [Desulfobacula sp.]|nr:protein BatD [Desulfobacula sp.]